MKQGAFHRIPIVMIAILVMGFMVGCASDNVPTVTANKQWTPKVQNFSGIDMVQVPPGCFQMGDRSNPDIGDGGRQCFDKAFWIDKTEVTQAQFKQLKAKQYDKPAFSGDNRPVEMITWYEARDLCAQRGARLPTEAEWEYAARGPDSLKYAWGNTFDASKIVYAGNSKDGTKDVGSKPAGASWVGALDMNGNVNEWTSTIFSAEHFMYPYDATDGRENQNDTTNNRVVRGGSWGSDEPYVDSAERGGNEPEGNGGGYLGVRCVRS